MEEKILIINSSIENIYKHLTDITLMSKWMVNLEKIEFVDESKKQANFYIKEGSKVTIYNGTITNEENKSSKVYYNNSSKMFGATVNLVLAISYKLEEINQNSCKLYYSMYTEIECEKKLVKFLITKLSGVFSKMIIKKQVTNLKKLTEKA